MGPLPQIYADMYGWKEMAEAVAGAYNKLSPEDKQRCAIFGQNYGQAGAIDFFGAKMGLPNAISGHQSYFYWGPRNYTGECMIVMDDSPDKTLQGIRFVGEGSDRLSSVLNAVSALRCLSLPAVSIGRSHNSGQD